MHITIACLHCGKLLRAPRELAGKPVRCIDCLKEFILPDGPAAAPAPEARSSATRPRPPRDDTLSRSMRTARPSLEVVQAEEMLCRLEPDTLRWLLISEPLREFLGMTHDQLRQQSFTKSLHPDDRALAEDELRQALAGGAARLRPADQGRARRLAVHAVLHPGAV